MSETKGSWGALAAALLVMGACSSSGTAPRDGSPDATDTHDAHDAAALPDGAAPDQAPEEAPRDAAPTDATDATDAVQAPSFSLVAPEASLPAGSESDACFYFHTSPTTNGLKRLTSRLGAGARRLVLMAGAAGQPADGTRTDGPCDPTAGKGLPTWLYLTTTAEGELQVPADLALAVGANAPLQMEVHFLNGGTAPIVAGARVDAFALQPGTLFKPTYPFVAYNANLRIPANATNHAASQTCPSFGLRGFWRLTTSTHKHAVSTTIKEGTEEVLVSTDWENPSVASWADTTFRLFPAGFTYECVYANQTGNEIRAGSSYENDETCIVFGYMYPASQAAFCVNGTLL